MSKALILDYFHAVDSHDITTLLKIFHPKIIYERPGYLPFVGLDQLRHFYEHERVLSSGEHKIEQLIVEGHMGASCGRFVGVRKDGSTVDERFADIYTFDSGRIRTRTTYFFRPAV